jgi:type IV fimbrial biogenesis protein FimT
MPRPAGFSLLELLVTLLTAAVVVGLGVPSFRTLALDSQRTADVNAFVTAVQLARSEAAKRGRAVVVCKTTDADRCAGREHDFTAGFMVFVNLDDARPPQRAADEPILYSYAPRRVGSIAANRELFEFRPFLRRSTNGTLVFCDARGSAAARAVIVSYTGRPRVADTAADGEPLACPS